MPLAIAAGPHGRCLHVHKVATTEKRTTYKYEEGPVDQGKMETVEY